MWTILRFKVSDQDSLSEALSLDEISDDWEQLRSKPETAQEITNKIVLTDTSQPSPNIQWPTIGEFTCELGVKKIEEYIKVNSIRIRGFLYYFINRISTH
ncbi:unnamed protein product [Trichobilharzia regenti]|nr:unnamed protein product [Trichobilharzia regenti]